MALYCDDSNSNSNSNSNMDVFQASFEEELNMITNRLEQINLNSDKRRREYFDHYAEPLIVAVSMPEPVYNYDEDAMIQESDNEDEDDDLFEIKHRLPEDNDMSISDTEEHCDDEEDEYDLSEYEHYDELRQLRADVNMLRTERDDDLDEIQWLRDEVEKLREEAAQQRIPFREGSCIRFTMVDGLRHLQVFQYVPPPDLTLADLSCDSEDDDA